MLPASMSCQGVDDEPSAFARESVVQLSRRDIGRDRHDSAVAPTGPVSSPSSIFITMTAVSVSPAMMARWMGAAPRQRGGARRRAR